MNGRYDPGDFVLGNWKLVSKIGEGSFGIVYEAHREDFGIQYRSAIKIITIPQSRDEIKSARSEGMSDESVSTYFRGIVEEIVQEFALMSKLKGSSNVVSYEDHDVIEHADHMGWDIIIRMELLTPLLDYIQSNIVSRESVIQLGIDICKALELCQKYNIIHRDIKPENIFVSESGDYKLGDFGIARTIDKTMGGLSKKGTYTYMAPEVYKEDPYNSTVDIYSLGIVLYRLLNDNRAPFLPLAPAPLHYNDRENAMAKRMSGTPLPAPSRGDNRLNEIVLKACAFQSRDRYSSPKQMRVALENVMQIRETIYTEDVQSEEVPHEVETSNTGEDETLSIFSSNQDDGCSHVNTSNHSTQIDLEEKTESIFDNTAPLKGEIEASQSQKKQTRTKRQKRSKIKAAPTNLDNELNEARERLRKCSRDREDYIKKATKSSNKKIRFMAIIETPVSITALVLSCICIFGGIVCPVVCAFLTIAGFPIDPTIFYITGGICMIPASILLLLLGRIEKVMKANSSEFAQLATEVAEAQERVKQLKKQIKKQRKRNFFERLGMR